jgi:hypothetical protein
MFHRALSRFALPGLLVVVASLTLSAQPPKAPAAEQSQIMTATIVTVNPGMAADYETFVKNEVIPAQKQGGLVLRRTYSSGAFGETGMYATFSPVASWSQFDQPSPVVKALGADGSAQLALKGAKFTSSRRVMLVRTRPDLSIAGDPRAEPSALALVTHIQVAAGRRADFEALLKKEVVPVMQQAKVKSYGVLEVLYGEEAGLYFSAVPFDNYEAIGKGHPLQVVLGDEGMKRLEAKFSGIVTHLERHVVRYRPELSFAQTKTTSQ